MTMLAAKAERIRGRFNAGTIPLDELLLHLEPILDQSAPDPGGQGEVRRIINAVEMMMIYSENEPRRSSLIVELLDAAVEFVRLSRSSPFCEEFLLVRESEAGGLCPYSAHVSAPPACPPAIALSAPSPMYTAPLR
jgi:hypothetical protein